MRIIFFLLCLMPLVAVANPLSHSKWEDESVSKCPTAIFFGLKKYIFINRCYSPRNDGVIERGIYAVSGESLTLANRQIFASNQFELIPRDVKQIRIQLLTAEHMELNVSGKTKPFRRLLPGSSNKPRKQPIQYFPSILDTAKIPARFF